MLEVLMAVKVLVPRDVQTTLNYHQTQDQIPYYYIGQVPPADVPSSNAVNDPHPITIHDMRGMQDAFDIDVCGFKWVTYPSAEKEFIDQKRIKTVYYPEIEDILKKHTGGKRVFIYDHTIRRSTNPHTGVVRLTNTAARGPSHYVHADHTFEYAAQKVRKCFPDDAERLLKGRYQILNVWRPIANIVAHYPLGIVDYRTVDADTDLVFARLLFPRMEGGMFIVKHNPQHKWYYLSDQTPDEVLIFKNFDSATDKARLAPHSAFPDLTSPADAPQRQSIEVRALVFDME